MTKPNGTKKKTPAKKKRKPRATGDNTQMVKAHIRSMIGVSAEVLANELAKVHGDKKAPGYSTITRIFGELQRDGFIEKRFVFRSQGFYGPGERFEYEDADLNDSGSEKQMMMRFLPTSAQGCLMEMARQKERIAALDRRREEAEAHLERLWGHYAELGGEFPKAPARRVPPGSQTTK
jgi:hypothetical protein